MPVYLTPPPRSPLARALAAVVGAILLVGAFMLGMVAFVIMLGLGLVAGAWVAFRTWQLRRAMEKGEIPAPRTGTPGDALEGEFTVVSREEDRSN